MKRLDELRRWFLSLQTRERRVLGGGTFILLLVIMYGGIVTPFMHSKAALVSHVAEQQALLAWMRPAAARLHALGATQPAMLPSGSLLATINRAAGDAGLGNAVRQVQQQNDGSVRVQLEGAAFDGLLHWLSDLHQQYGISISDLSVQRGTGAGMVNAHVRLQAPSA